LVKRVLKGIRKELGLTLKFKVKEGIGVIISIKRFLNPKEGG